MPVAAPVTEYRNVTLSPEGRLAGQKTYRLSNGTQWAEFSASLDLFLIWESDIDHGADDWSEIRDSESADLVDLVEEALAVISAETLAARLGLEVLDITNALATLAAPTPNKAP